MMIAPHHRAVFIAGATTIALLTAIAPAHAQVAVFDAANFSQNVLTAARELQQVNNEIQSLENEATMLENEAKNLASLPYSSLAELDQSITQTQQLLSQAQNIAYDVTTIDEAFTQVYPQSYASSASSSQLESDAETRWKNARAGYQDAMNIQAGVVQNLATTHAQIDALISSSQSAEGALQASQAGNQMLAIQSGQLADLTALIAAQGRAQALAGASDAEAQAQAQAQLSQFLTTGTGYQAGSVQMFHQQ